MGGEIDRYEIYTFVSSVLRYVYPYTQIRTYIHIYVQQKQKFHIKLPYSYYM